MKRRKLGPAYERAPAEVAGDWVHRNLLVLASIVVFSVIFLILFNVFVDQGLNFIASGGDEATASRFDSNHPTAVAAKIIGVILISVLLIKSRAK